MYSPTLERTINGWTLLADTLVVPHTEAGYDRLVSLLDELIDTIGENEDHPLADYAPDSVVAATVSCCALDVL